MHSNSIELVVSSMRRLPERPLYTITEVETKNWTRCACVPFPFYWIDEERYAFGNPISYTPKSYFDYIPCMVDLYRLFREGSWFSFNISFGLLIFNTSDPKFGCIRVCAGADASKDLSKDNNLYNIPLGPCALSDYLQWYRDTNLYDSEKVGPLNWNWLSFCDVSRDGILDLPEDESLFVREMLNQKLGCQRLTKSSHASILAKRFWRLIPDYRKENQNPITPPMSQQKLSTEELIKQLKDLRIEPKRPDEI